MHPTHNVSPHESARTARTTLTSPRARRVALAAALVVGALALAACAPGPNPDVGTPTGISGASAVPGHLAAGAIRLRPWEFQVLRRRSGA